VFTKGVVMRGEIYAQLQIETKDIFNSDKLNFQAVAMQQCMHNSFSGAGVNESWIFQDDDGENFNGWSQGQLFFAGYEYPLSSDRYVTTGALLTTLGNLSNRDISPMDKGGWGSDFTKLRISPLVNVKVSKNLEWVVLFSFIRARVFSNDVPYFKMGEYRGTEFLYEKVQTQISYTFGRWGDWVK
jgi:hypothetical protein